MEPGAAVTGRLMDANGQPRAGVELRLFYRPKEVDYWSEFSPERIQTDREGRFRIVALLPRYAYRLDDGKGQAPIDGTLRAGQTRDLGDVQVK